MFEQPIKSKSVSSESSDYLESVSIRFAGDSGDGMQLTGNRFATISASLGDQVLTLADYPSEIRAPAGTISGVSGYQLKIGANEVYTTGDEVDILVAMNPAALKINLPILKMGGTLLVDTDAFSEKNLAKAKYQTNPLEDGQLSGYRVLAIGITSATKGVLADSKLNRKEIERCKNFYSLGILCWILSKNIKPTYDWITKKFAKNPEIVAANHKVLEAGYDCGEVRSIFESPYAVRKETNDKKPGLYRYINGNTACALALVAAGVKAKKRVFLGSYPITPATEILQELSKLRHFDVVTFQAEDEISGIGSALGASFAGALAATSTSGPGLSLKSEFLGLAVMAELPLVVIDVQRAGPSTGLPTKTEQADLLQAIYGRNGDAPLVVLAASSPGDCFASVYEACRIAIKYMTPVIVLTDGYLANGAEGWRIPEIEALPEFEPSKTDLGPDRFTPYIRDPETLARPWTIPGTPRYEHRIGGLEKEDVTGLVSHNPKNHDKMTRLRAAKIKRVESEIEPTKIYGDLDAKVLVVTWGSTFGAAREAIDRTRAKGAKLAHLNLKYLNPLPPDLGIKLEDFDQILVPEVNYGQLAILLQATYQIKVRGLNKVEGRPLRVNDIEKKILTMLGDKDNG